MRRAHSSLFRTTRKADVVGALFLLVLHMVFLVRNGLETSVGRGLAGLEQAAKAGIVVSQLSRRSLRSPRGTERETELYARTIQTTRMNQRVHPLSWSPARQAPGPRDQSLPARQAPVRRAPHRRKGVSH
jgi:hypothetical protein